MINNTQNSPRARLPSVNISTELTLQRLIVHNKSTIKIIMLAEILQIQKWLKWFWPVDFLIYLYQSLSFYHTLRMWNLNQFHSLLFLYRRLPSWVIGAQYWANLQTKMHDERKWIVFGNSYFRNCDSTTIIQHTIWNKLSWKA